MNRVQQQRRLSHANRTSISQSDVNHCAVAPSSQGSSSTIFPIGYLFPCLFSLFPLFPLFLSLVHLFPLLPTARSSVFPIFPSISTLSVELFMFVIHFRYLLSPFLIALFHQSLPFPFLQSLFISFPTHFQLPLNSTTYFPSFCPFQSTFYPYFAILFHLFLTCFRTYPPPSTYIHQPF